MVSRNEAKAAGRGLSAEYAQCDIHRLGHRAAVILQWLHHEKVVTVPEVHELHHWHSDTIRQTDSVVNNQTTVIREVDSATMAQDGIRLDKAQRAWLIQNDRLSRIERLHSMSANDRLGYPCALPR